MTAAETVDAVVPNFRTCDAVLEAVVAGDSRAAPLRGGRRRYSIASEKAVHPGRARYCSRGYPLNAILSSLGAFLAAALRPQTPLAKAIVAVLVIKLIAIAGIGASILAGGGQTPVGAEAMARLLGPPVSPQEWER